MFFETKVTDNPAPYHLDYIKFGFIMAGVECGEITSQSSNYYFGPFFGHVVVVF